MNQIEFAVYVRRWLPLAIVIALVCGAGTFLVSRFVLTPAYTGTVTMQVEPAAISHATIPPDPTYSVTLAQTYAAVAQEHSIAQQAYLAAVPIVGSLHDLQVMVSQQSPSASCQTNGITALISCSVTAKSASFTTKAANALAHIFIRFEQTTSPNKYWNVRVVNPATVPSGPSSPHSTLNALVAFFLALLLVLAIGYLLLRWSTVQPTHTLESSRSRSPVASGPASD